VHELTFGYDRQKPFLHDISFNIEKGETVAFVGPSGVGKTTLVNLLCRFYSPVNGGIRIGGRDIGVYDVESYRRHISYVTQESFLFTGTVAANIRYGNPSIGPDEVEKAARLANAHEFIKNLPNGYDAELGERGVNLSGGQKQRLNIARALVRNPDILIMDEPSSALDAESESTLLEALQTVFRDRTCIIIAHRLSTVMAVDRIFVFDAGRIVQTGPHRELIAADGLYRELCRKQFLGFGGAGPKDASDKEPDS
jgi:ABC-type multidrug transport system fused ATPase/permease subunit